jgi:glucose dehydrogenase
MAWTVAELVGLALMVAGVWLAFGTSAALVVAGAMLVLVSFVVNRNRGTS